LGAPFLPDKAAELGRRAGLIAGLVVVVPSLLRMPGIPEHARCAGRSHTMLLDNSGCTLCSRFLKLEKRGSALLPDLVRRSRLKRRALLAALCLFAVG